MIFKALPSRTASETLARAVQVCELFPFNNHRRAVRAKLARRHRRVIRRVGRAPDPTPTLAADMEMFSPRSPSSLDDEVSPYGLNPWDPCAIQARSKRVVAPPWWEVQQRPRSGSAPWCEQRASKSALLAPAPVYRASDATSIVQPSLTLTSVEQSSTVSPVMQRLKATMKPIQVQQSQSLKMRRLGQSGRSQSFARPPKTAFV